MMEEQILPSGILGMLRAWEIFFSGIRREAKGLEGMVVLGIPAGLGTSVIPSCRTWQLRPSWTGEIGRWYPEGILWCGLKPGIKYFLLVQQ